MKTFAVYSYEPTDLDDDDIDDETEKFATFEIETLRALQSIASRKGCGRERETCDQSMDHDTLSDDQVATIRRLETEFAREIAEFKAKRRPIRESITDGPPVSA